MILKLGGAFGAFSWVTLSSDCRFELQSSESEPADRPREFRKSLHNIYSHSKIHFNKKSLKRLLSFDESEARTLVWKPDARVNDMFRYDCGEGF